MKLLFSTGPARHLWSWVAVVIMFSLAGPADGQGYICAEGGGLGWSTPAGQAMVAWMLEKSGGGEVVVLGSLERDPEADDPAVEAFIRGGASRVTPLVITQENADRPETIAAIRRARVVWIRGGDQSRYVRWWQDTETELAMAEVFRSGGALGGTSAGAAILGEVSYDARVGSLRPEQALADAAHENLTLVDGFLGLVPGVLFDTHFTERGRIGRLPVMMARARRELAKDVLGVGLDTRTALCISPDGTAEVIGQGAVTVLALTDETREELTAGAPPTVTDIEVVQMVAGYRYDLRRRRVLERPSCATPQRIPDAAMDGPLMELQIDGAKAEDAGLARLAVLDGGKTSALLHGELEIVPRPSGSTRPWLPRTFIATRTWDDPRFAENRVGGVLLGMASYPGWMGLCLGSGSRAQVSEEGILTVARGGSPARSLLLFDGAGVTHSGFSKAVVGEQSAGPRQSVALEGAVLHVLGPGWGFDLTVREIVEPVR